MESLRRLACKFDLDRSERKSTQVHARPGQGEFQVFSLRLPGSLFGQARGPEIVNVLNPGIPVLHLVLSSR